MADWPRTIFRSHICFINQSNLDQAERGQGHLGEVVSLELPEAGMKVSQGGAFGNMERVKATIGTNSPIGEVIKVNSKLSETRPGMHTKHLASIDENPFTS